MALIRRILQSFSFRLLFVALLLFFAVTIIMRFALYHATMRDALEDVKHTINEQYLQIDEGIRKRGYQHGLNLISTIMHFDIENVFALAYRDSKGRIREGNLTAWPEVSASTQEWFTFRVATLPQPSIIDSENDKIISQMLPFLHQDDTQYKNFLARIHTYPNGAQLLVGYDMRHVNQLRATILGVVVENSIVSILAALACSILLAYWINRRLRLINRTCARVIAGNLEERAPSNGSADEFDQLSGNFNAMLSWISQLIHSIKDSTNSLAHDMRTPLSRHRIGLTKMLEDDGLPDNTRQMLQNAVSEVDRIVELYDAILNISRAESRVIVGNFTDCNIHAILQNVVELYEIFAEQNAITLTLHCDPTLTLNGEQQMLAQAIANLVDNALKYAPPHSTVTITAVRSAQAITIQICDEGEGIPEAERENVKQRFYRLDKSRTTSGTGLGLSLVDAVMQLHQGKFILESNTPRGLKAILQFPLKTTR